MRIWHPIPPLCLDTKLLVAEHNELHILYKGIDDPEVFGWRNHPEFRRWTEWPVCPFANAHKSALAKRHKMLVEEARRRGLPMGTDHKTPLPYDGVHVQPPKYERYYGPERTSSHWPDPWEPLEVMREKLAAKIASRMGG